MHSTLHASAAVCPPRAIAGVCCRQEDWRLKNAAETPLRNGESSPGVCYYKLRARWVLEKGCGVTAVYFIPIDRLG